MLAEDAIEGRWYIAAPDVTQECNVVVDHEGCTVAYCPNERVARQIIHEHNAQIDAVRVVQDFATQCANRLEETPSDANKAAYLLQQDAAQTILNKLTTRA